VQLHVNGTETALVSGPTVAPICQALTLHLRCSRHTDLVVQYAADSGGRPYEPEIQKSAESAVATVETISCWIRDKSKGKTKVIIQDLMPRGENLQNDVTLQYKLPSKCVMTLRRACALPTAV
jgi:hypothetical protein